MGIYLNPGNDAFASILKKDIYIDKSGLISYTNRVSSSISATVSWSIFMVASKSLSDN